jgi:hypothetical protein
MRLAQLPRPCRLVALALVALLLAPASGAAQGPSVFSYNTFTTAVALVTTTEIEIVASPALATPREEVNVVVLCFGQLTTGTMTTGVIPRIRRGSTIAGTLVSEENTITVGAAAGSTEQFFVMVSEERAATNVQYVCTLDQVAADGNGSAIYGAILVLAR